MDTFHRYAVQTVARDAGFVALTAITLMIGFSFAPSLSLKIGASIALLFSIFLLLRAVLLDEHRVIHTEVWKGLMPEERPSGEAGYRDACEDLKQVLFRVARSASGIAAVLFASSLIASLGVAGRTEHALVSATLD